MTRYNTAKLSMAVFLASEFVFFAFLIAAYVYFYGAVVQGPRASNSLNPPRTLVFTMCLVASSATMWMAERRLRNADRREFRIWLGLTIFLGAVFVFGQATEYAGLIAKTITPARNLFGATFFTLTGFHGLHVLAGLISLSALLGLTFRKNFGAKEISGAGAIAMYWHFVDAVWVVIFCLVYASVWI